MKRRELLASTAWLACRASDARPVEAPAAAQHTFLLVHGAWHSSIHWNRVAVELSNRGHRVVAVDLPGNGLEASVPDSYTTKDQTGIDRERSKIAAVGLRTYVDAVMPVLTRLSDAHGPVTLVGHSFGGMTITLLAERAPRRVRRLVYLSAFCPSTLPGGSINDYSALPENARGLAGSVIIGDPGRSGAFRINPRSTDASYVERLRLAFYGDVTAEVFSRFAMFLTPDLPLEAAQGDARGSAGRWGSVPRTYVRCLLDRAIPIELQDRMIRDADSMTPRNRFTIASLESSHSPFASMPEAVARVLAGTA